MTYPPVGVFIGILGLLGIFVPLIRDLAKMGKWEKALWTAVIFALLLLEIKSIYYDRSEHDAQQAEARAEQLRHFNEIAAGINTSIEKSGEQFKATMDRTDTLITKASENIDAVTGGRDFVVVDIVGRPVQGDGLSLQAVVNGKNVVRDVRCAIEEGRPPYTFTHDFVDDVLSGKVPKGVTPCQLGNVVPGLATSVAVLHPPPDKGAFYNINVYAFNGTTNEKLEVRFNQSKGLWERQLTITRGNHQIRKLDWNQ